MFYKKNLRKVVAGLSLVAAGIFLNSNAFADPCSSIILGSESAGVACSFESGIDGITISSGATVGGIYQDAYNASGFIINNGTIASELTYGIYIFNGSSLGLGLTNNGLISTTSSAGIFVDTSVISHGIANNGIVINNETDPAIIITNSTINGSVTNSGIIRNLADSDGIYIASSTISGDFINSGNVRGYLNGLELNNSATLGGSITNSGAITGDSISAIKISNSVEVSGDLTNSGTVSGEQYGILMDNAIIAGSIINQTNGVISGSDYGININGSSVTHIDNYGTITGNIAAIYVDPSSTVSSIGLYEGSVINGNIDAITTGINYYGGEINGSINANNFNIQSGAIFNMSHAITIADTLNNSGTLSVGTSARTVNGNYLQLSGGVFDLSISSPENYGQLLITNDADLSASGKINLNILSGSNIAAGQVFNNIISAGGVLTTPTTYEVTDDSYLLKFSASSGLSGLSLVAFSDENTSVAKSASTHGNNAGAGAAYQLDKIISLNSSGDWQNVIGALNSLSSSQAVSDAVNQTIPTLAGATNTALIETMNTAMRIIQARQDANSGFSSGDDFKTNRNLWAKAFGSWGDQGNKNGVIGYDSTSYGFIAGADKSLDEANDFGVGFSYFNSRLSNNTKNNKVDVDSFLGVIYGSRHLENETEVNGEIALSYGRNNSSRYINFANLSRVAKSSYDSWNFHAGSSFGRLLKLDKTTEIAPQFRLDYFNVSNESYKESGANSLNLHVGSQSQSQLILAFETKANQQFNSRFSLALNAGLGYDLLNNRNKVSASFENSGESFTTEGFKPSPWILRSGLGFVWKKNNDVDFTIRYDRRDRGDYANQAVSFKMSKRF